jgi:hypothetical protein
MKLKHAFTVIVAGVFMCCGIAMAFDLGISSQANWWGQDAADREMDELADAVSGVVGSVEIFPADKQAELADWVKNHTQAGAGHILFLCGQVPDTIYAPGNTQADDSLIEMFMDAGNTVINTGDYLMYVVNAAGTNAAGGLQTLMDIPAITMWDDDTAMIATAEGKAWAPSLQDFASDRPFHLDELEGGWEAEFILAQNDAGTRADPVIVINRDTGGRAGIFYQTASQDDDPRSEVIGEFINSIYATTAVEPANRVTTSWGAIKSE